MGTLESEPRKHEASHTRLSRSAAFGTAGFTPAEALAALRDGAVERGEIKRGTLPCEMPRKSRQAAYAPSCP
jgi:hypothetical protein